MSSFSRPIPATVTVLVLILAGSSPWAATTDDGSGPETATAGFAFDVDPFA